MKLNRKLHVVIPVYDEDGATVSAYVHYTPISREVFEAHHVLLAKTFAYIHSEGLGAVAGPRIASLLMRKVAKADRDEAGAATLMNEIRRLANALVKSPTGWEAMPFQDVVDRNLFDDGDLSEVENALVFFTVDLAMLQRSVRQEMVAGAASLWGAQISQQSFTEFQASLRTSIVDASSGARQAHASSVPH